jgi:hypothetical protein
MAHRAIVNEQSPPKHSGLADWYSDADLLDSFAVELPASSNGNIRAIAHAILGQPAPWFIRTVLSIRDGVGRHVGLRTPGDRRSADHDGDRINSLPVLSAHDDELILGKDDQHMNFRISLMIQKSIDGPNLISTTTVVRCHNRLGRTYLAAIKPFHRLLVPSNLRRAAESGFAVVEST